LAPIWSVTDTGWGAISKGADQWIFLGDPKIVESTLAASTPELPPSTAQELYRARVVPARGLNVRDAIQGHVLRALACNTVVRVYEERRGWARIHPLQSEWVNAVYLSKVVEPAFA
jgi:hypothetical protein